MVVIYLHISTKIRLIVESFFVQALKSVHLCVGTSRWLPW